MKYLNKSLSLLLAVALVFLLCTAAFATQPGEYEGKAVILHTNDVHGAVESYAKVAALKEEFQEKGADVLLVDAGDFIQGSPYVSASKGATAVEIMNAVGYDIVTLGNHEFDYGYENLLTILESAEFAVTSNIYYEGELAFSPAYVAEADSGLKVGVFGLTTPETATSSHPAKIKGVSFLSDHALYEYARTVAESLKQTDGCDIVVCISHLGVDDSSEPNRSYDLLENAGGIDFILDAHSHTVMTEGENGEAIQSTGSGLANVGVVVLGEDGVEENYLIDLAEYDVEVETVKALVKTVVDEVDEQYGEVFAKTEVDLNGERVPGNRTGETNLGNLIADAALWVATKDGELDIAAENIVAVVNGGGIRASVSAGDITMLDINTVLPFGNTVSYVTVTGCVLLEALEAATAFAPEASGAFPQVAGMVLTVNTGADFVSSENYDGSTYEKPEAIRRVEIDSINGREFDPEATYMVVTNDFVAAGGDAYYAFSVSESVDTGLAFDEAVISYITEFLGGVVGEEYALPEGRINVVEKEPYTDVYNSELWYYDAVVDVYEKGIMTGVTDHSFEPDTDMNRGMLVTMLYRLAGSPEVGTEVSEIFTDCLDGIWYSDAVVWAYENGIVDGMGNGTFAPYATLTRQQMAKILYGYAVLSGEADQTTDLTFADTAAIASWAVDGVEYCVAAGLMNGVGDNRFDPSGSANRAMGAAVLSRMAA